MSIELFYSYAHEDEPLRQELEKHLSLLKRQGYITGWHDRDISAGKEWGQEIDTHLNSARVILLLVSPDFVASDYCYDIEVKRAMQRHESGEACVIPVILRPVDWHEAIFGKLKALPKDGKAVRLWPDHDAAFYDIARGIREVIQGFSSTPSSLASPADSPLKQQKELQAMPSTSQTSSGHDPVQGLEHPATALLSYAWEDAEEVKYLQLQLKVRGVRAWRDVTDLPLGGATEDEIIHAIENVADAIVIYVTPNLLKSSFVWKTEIKAALERRKRDPLFNIVSILKDVSFEQLQQKCIAYNYRSLKDFNAVPIVNSVAHETGASFEEQLRSIANRVLKATLALRMRRVKANSAYEPWVVLRTFPDTPLTPALDLDLNWLDIFQGKDRLPPAEEWRDILFPALKDVKNALGELSVSRNLHIALNAILPTAFALGYFFPRPARYKLLLASEDGTWSTAGTTNASPTLDRIPYDGTGNPEVAVVEVSVTFPTAHDTSLYLAKSGLSYGHHVRYRLEGGENRINGVRDASHALAMAHYIGAELSLLSGQGVRYIHLFATVPAPLAVMIGHQFNALCPISLYYHVPGRGYEPACTLGLSTGE